VTIFAIVRAIFALLNINIRNIKYQYSQYSNQQIDGNHSPNELARVRKGISDFFFSGNIELRYFEQHNCAITKVEVLIWV